MPGYGERPDLLWKSIQIKAGIKAKIIPYDGGAEALIALLGGHIDVACLFPTQSTPHIKAENSEPSPFRIRNGTLTSQTSQR